jgi:ABC-type branched-subunit amino acid transport system substrate-binding protein
MTTKDGNTAGGRTDRSRRTVLTAAGVAGVTGLAGCTGAIGGGSSGPITLGIAFPYTGTYSESATRQRDGVDLAVKEINDNGGLMERDVEVVDRDTELNADVSARQVNDLLKNEDVDLLCANLSGGISIQTQSLAKNDDTPYMAGCQTIPKFHMNEDLGEGSFAAGALNTHCAMAAVDLAFDEGLGESFYGVYADYGWGRSIWDWAKQRIDEHDGTVSGEVAAPLGNQDFSSQLQSARDSGADILYMANAGVDTANMLKQIDQFDLREQMELLTPNNSTGWTTIAGREAWEGIYTGMQWYQGVEDDVVDEWAGKMNDEHGYPGATYASITYNGVKEFERAVRETQSLTTGDIGSFLEGAEPFHHVKSYDETWRACDNQLVTEWYTMVGKPADQMGERGEWDAFEVLGAYGGEELLPECSYYE